MTDLVESADWTPGIRQFETSDPVEGGPDGIDNVPLRQLANRTRYLKDKQDAQTGDLGLKASIDSPAFTGVPQAPLAAQFDDSTKLATTSFVQRALGSLSGMVGINTSTVLGAANFGNLVVCNGSAAITVTLPAASTASQQGATVHLLNQQAHYVIVQCAGSDQIWAGAGSASSTLIGIGETLSLTTNGTSWYVSGGTAGLRFAQRVFINTNTDDGSSVLQVGGIASASTASQFDNSTKLATTAFVQQSLGNMRGTYVTKTSGTLGAAQAGMQVFVTSPGTTQTINFAELKDGARMTVYANYATTGTTTLAINGPAKFVAVASSTAPTITLNPGDAISLVVDDTNVNIEVTTANLRYSAAFNASLSANGYQKLPSGLIIQWGYVAVAGISGTTVAFPLAFPNACLSLACASDDAVANGTQYRWTIGSRTKTSFVAANNWNGIISGSWIAVGY